MKKDLEYNKRRLRCLTALVIVAGACLSGAAFAQDASDPAEPLVPAAVEASGRETAEPVPPQDDLLAPLPSIEQDIEDFVLSEEEAVDIDADLFFDAEELIPDTPGLPQQTTRRVNPQLEPGKKLIIVKTDHKSKSKKAQMTAASRAGKLGRYDSALEIYNDLYAQDPMDPEILLGRAVTLQQMGSVDSAIMAYGELLDLDPASIEAQINMLGLMGQQYPAVALRRLTELRQTHPNNVAIVSQLAVVQAEVGQHEEALRSLGIAAGMDPKNAVHLFNMAVIADKSGATKKAVQYYEQALEVDTIYGGGRTIPREAVFERLAGLR